jgi:hypothetical protein
MSTVAEIEKAIEKLPPEQWMQIRRWMDRHPPKNLPAMPRQGLPRVAATGRAITQEEIDDALDSD